METIGKFTLYNFIHELDNVVNNAYEGRTDEQIVDYVQMMLNRDWDKLESISTKMIGNDR